MSALVETQPRGFVRVATTSGCNWSRKSRSQSHCRNTRCPTPALKNPKNCQSECSEAVSRKPKFWSCLTRPSPSRRRAKKRRGRANPTKSNRTTTISLPDSMTPNLRTHRVSLRRPVAPARTHPQATRSSHKNRRRRSPVGSASQNAAVGVAESHVPAIHRPGENPAEKEAPIAPMVAIPVRRTLKAHSQHASRRSAGESLRGGIVWPGKVGACWQTRSAPLNRLTRFFARVRRRKDRERKLP